MSRKKRKERQFKTNFKENNHLQVITGGQLETIQRSKEVRIVPRNFKQDDLLELLQDDTKHQQLFKNTKRTDLTFRFVGILFDRDASASGRLGSE